MTGQRSPHEIACVECGHRYAQLDKRDKSRCPKCRREIRNAYKRAKDTIARKNAFTLTIVHDPLKPGGFDPGTVLPKTDVEEMLRNQSFTPGTVVRDNSGAEYRFDPAGRRFLSVRV